MTHQYTLRVEAARAGAGIREYLSRLRQGLVYCWRCEDWHQADEFDVDPRRHTGRAGSCRRAIRAAVAEDLAGRGLLPPPAAVWVVTRLEPAPQQAGGKMRSYWHGPVRAPGARRGRLPGTWSPALDDRVARFPGASEATRALISAFGRRDAVPAGCRLVRLA